MFRKLLERLKHKYGPLPLWAWTAIAGAGVYLWNRSRGGPAEGEAAAPAFSPAYAFGEGGGEPDYGDTGAPVGPVAPEEQAASEFYPDNKLREATMELVDQIRGYTEDVEAARGVPVEGYEDVVEPDSVGDVATPAKPAQPAAGVRWGGRVFKTKAGLAAWLASHGAGGGQRARAFSEWAKKHPGAAAKLAGPKPKAPKKQAPKAPKRPSARTPGREPAKAGRGAGGARARAPQPAPKKAARPRPAPPRRQAPQPPPKPKPARRVVARIKARRA